MIAAMIAKFTMKYYCIDYLCFQNVNTFETLKHQVVYILTQDKNKTFWNENLNTSVLLKKLLFNLHFSMFGK